MQINAKTETRQFALLAFGVLFAFMAVALIEDLRLKMWNDEIVTVYVSRQGTIADIISATKAGMDATPPLYPILVSKVSRVLRNDAVATRLPSTFGFAAMLLFVALFCHRRMPASYAVSASLLCWATAGFYATEGRCYGLVLGCVAGALYCWQKSCEPDGRTRWLCWMALLLAAAVSLHYYAIFCVVPLIVGEFLKWRGQKEFVRGVAYITTPAAVVVGLHLSLIREQQKYLPHFWVPGLVTWHQVPGFYFHFAALPAAVALVALVLRALRSPRSVNESSGLLLHEKAAVIAVAAMPIVVIVVCKYITHVFVARYVLWAILGLAIGSIALLWSSSFKSSQVGIAALASLAIVVAGLQGATLLRTPKLRQGEDVARVIDAYPNDDQPIVIAYDHAFMELSYYAAPALRRRLVYPVSRDLELRYTGSDLEYQLLKARAPRADLQVVDLEAFLKDNSRFLLAATPSDYLPTYLSEQHFILSRVASNRGASLYLVTKR